MAVAFNLNCIRAFLLAGSLVLSQCVYPVTSWAQGSSTTSQVNVYDDPSTADIRKAREDSFAQPTESAKKKTLAAIVKTCQTRLEKEPNNVALLVWYSASLEQMAGYVTSPGQSAKLCEQAIDLAEQAIKLDSQMRDGLHAKSCRYGAAGKLET